MFSVIQNVYCHKVQFFYLVFNRYIVILEIMTMAKIETNPSKNNYIDAEKIIKTTNYLFIIGKTQYIN